MKKVIIKAGLSIVGKSHQIQVTNQGSELVVNIIGKPAFYLPFRQLLKGYALIKKTIFLNQLIQIKRNDRNLLKVNQGKVKIDSYPMLIKIFIRSVVG